MSPDSPSSPPPDDSFYLTLVHAAVPGRVRFRVPVLHRDEPLCAALGARLQQLPGITTAQANPRTDSLLILFDPALSLDDLADAIGDTLSALLDERDQERPPYQQPAPARPGPEFGNQHDSPPRPAEPVPIPLRLHALRASLNRWMRAVRDRAASATDGPLDPPDPPDPASFTATAPWHALTADEALARLASSTQGLSHEVWQRRLAATGGNILPPVPGRSELGMLLEQFASPPVALLGISAAISIATGGLVDAGVIAGVVVINALIGFVTERQSERTIAALVPQTRHTITTLRAGRREEAAVDRLVPGDVVLLTPGNLVPADARLLATERLSLDEAALTGESLPVEKNAARRCHPDAPLADRLNMAYRGTLVTGGSATALIVGTGLNTEIGRIQALAGAARPPATVVERQLDEMGLQLALLSGGICGVVFVVGLLRGQAWVPMLKTAISLAVAAVPEGLPTVATTTLAIGIRDMRRRNVLVRRLDAIQTLGAVQIFCLDKTGTLTLNHMTVTALYVGGQRIQVDEHGGFISNERPLDLLQIPECRRLLEIVALCNEIEWNGPGGDKPSINGSATETALVELALRAGLNVSDLRAHRPQLAIQHRAEDRPYMVTVHPEAGRHLIAVKGSPPHVLNLCRWHLVDGEQRSLDAPTRERIAHENERMAGAALRVLGIAFTVQEAAEPEGGERVWLGLAGMADPLRPGMKSLLHRFHEAGIKTAIVTGDQSATAYAIARELDLADGQALEMLDSVALDKLEPDLLRGLIQQVQVYSRVSPAHKLQIVQALQRAGKVVAMTGDGINDGPALKAADLGVAMGGAGTDVARSVADIVIEDDNLNTMVIAIQDGRTIYSNIRKAVRFLLATNLSEIEVMLAAVGLGLGPPLNPMQLLWINLATDVFPSLALALESPEPNVLQQPPRDPETPILSRADLARLFQESAVITTGALGAFAYGLWCYGQGPRANTLTFMTLTAAQLLHALSSRSERHSLLRGERLPPNRYLQRALVISLALQIGTVLVPGLRRFLGTTPLNLLYGLVVGAGAALPLLINESTKSIDVAPAAGFLG